MAYAHYDRLTALDTSFLDLESPDVHMHVGSVGIFDGGALTDEHGALDFDQVLALSETSLRRIPRFRQKLEITPVSGHPVWVDDEHFNPLYHLRHTALPFPGDERRLKRLVARIMSQKLDRSKPMWEMWFVEGLEKDRFAVISKIHHCMIDGVSGVDLLSAFMGAQEDFRAEAPDHRWVPRPKPNPLGLLRDDVWRRVTLPARALSGARRMLKEPRRSFDGASRAASGLAETFSGAFSQASETPFNVPIGPHRRFDWTYFDLGVVKEIRQKLGGTVNDVALACVAGAARDYLTAHEVDLSEIEFRTMVPVSTRADSEHGKLGNRVSMLVVRLPVGESDPRLRLAKIVEETSQVKESTQTEGTDLLEEISDLTTTGLLTQMSRLAASRRAFNMVVTNVPGPQMPVFLNGARMLASYPLVPLFTNQALGVALFGFDGGLFWGFNADHDAIPDLHEFVLAVEREFETLRKL